MPYLSVREDRKRVAHEIRQIANEEGALVIAVYVMIDHTHLLVKLPNSIAPSVFMGAVKRRSAFCMNQNEQVVRWQRGFGAFHLSEAQGIATRKYIVNQEEHHKLKQYEDFLDESTEF
ncbi:MAG: transposase [Flavobacteriia bacterium]|nr:transposase [Flavobacteriia bacterium]